MNCEKYTEWLSAALDGELTAEQRRELDAHLEVCPDCASLFETLSANAQALRELDCQFPEGLHERIISNLPAQDIPAKKSKVIHWKRWGSLAACLVLVAAAGVFARFGGIRMGSMAPAMELAEPPAGENSLGGGSVASYDNKLDDSARGEAEDFFLSPEISLSPESSVSFPGGTMSYSEVQYLRVGYGFTPAPSAVVISSAQSLADYLTGYGTNRFDGEGNPVPIAELEALAGTYTEDFFESRSLLAVLVETGSGSIRHEVKSVTADTVTIRVIAPEIGTADMAAWLILIELDEVLDDGSTLEVKFTH